MLEGNLTNGPVASVAVLTISSKLGSILFTRELAHWLDKRGSSDVYANCFFPGK